MCKNSHWLYTQLSSTLQYVVKIDYLVDSAHYQRSIQHVTNMESLLRLRSYTTLLSSAVTLGHMSTAQDRCNIFFVSSLFLLCFPCFSFLVFHFLKARYFQSNVVHDSIHPAISGITPVLYLYRETTCFGDSPSSNAKKIYFSVLYL